MRKSSLLYICKEFQRKKNAIFSVYIVVTISAFVLFCFSMLSYGSYIAQVDSLYHAYISNLSYDETEEIVNSILIKEAETFHNSNGQYTVCVEFFNGDPLLIDHQCQNLISGLGYSINTDQKNTPHWVVNDQYYNLTITPYVTENIGSMFIFLFADRHTDLCDVEHKKPKKVIRVWVHARAWV